MDPFDSFVVFSIKHGMGNVNDLHELQTRSVFRGHSMNCRRAASFAGTQCLSRLRRTHGVFSRLRRTHSVSRAYGGRTASLAPTADAQRLSRLRRTHSVFSRLRRTHGVFSRLRRSLRKRTARSLFSAPYRKALQRQAKIFIQAKITVPPHVRNRRIKYRRPQP